MRSVVLWFKSRRGATAIEYSLIVAGIAIAVATAVFLTGGSLAKAFESIEHIMSGIAGGMK